MHSYTAFVHGGIKVPGDNAQADGNNLARQCLEKLKSAGDAKQFPPKLLILMASPAYSELQIAKRLLAGIREVFEGAGHGAIKLIGTSVAAVFFEHEIHDKGALLVCLASRLLDVETGVGRDASQNPEAAVSSLLGQLKLDDQGKDLNPMSNRMLLTFFPDIVSGGKNSTTYASDELHKLLWNATLCRIPVAGGVSSSYRSDGYSVQGLQFCGWGVYTDTLVAAQVDSGAPLGVSLCRGLEPLKDEKGLVRLRVKSISDDGSFIDEMEDSRGMRWDSNGDYFLLSEDTNERDFIIARSEQPGGSRFRITDKVAKGDTLQVRRLRPDMLLDMASDIVEQANKRVHVKHPLACLSLICSSHFRNSREFGLDIAQAITNIEQKYHTCVGGFVDGEAGVDYTGRSQFGNWSMVGIGFGDEMRDRTPLHLGFRALAAYSPRLTEETKLDDAITESLGLIFETGFPGAMISFPLRDQSQDRIVGMGAIGERFNQIVSGTRRLSNGHDALANVIRSGEPRFIRDTGVEPDCDPAEKEVLTSQYIIPLRGPGNDIIAVLQIDLGRTEELSPSLREVLDSLGAAVAGGINRILNWEVVGVARQLDQALKASLSAETLKEGLQSFIEETTRIFGASMGHVRIANLEKRSLILAAGVGEYYEAARVYRSEIDFDENSPTYKAYSSDEIIIVNDAHNNPEHQVLIEKCRGSLLEKPLERVASYANTSFRGQGNESIGTINLVSEKEWFFTWQHQHSLEALGERVGFLVEHLEQKEKKAEANRRLDFLLNASPQLSRVRDFDDMPTALREATERFCTAAHAHVASLYLWDEQIGKFILRAESGWEESAWVNAARYKNGEGWIGKLGDEPLHDYELNVEEERYVRQMFGDEPDEGWAISAIGLPLIVRGRTLGVLALYRSATRGDAGGFANTDFRDLRESADSMAALLSILLSRQETLFNEKMQEYFERISKIFLRDETLDALEGALCELIVEMFGATSADFYFYGDALVPRSVTGYSAPGSPRRRRRRDNLIRRVRGSGTHEAVLREITDGERENPTLAAAEGRITRQCIPVFVEQKIAGVLDILWSEEQRRADWELIRHSEQQLTILGTVIGSAYNRYTLAAGQEVERRAKEKERRSKEAKQRGLQAMNALQLQSAHHFKNLLVALGLVPRLIRAASSQEEQEELASDLAERLQKGHTFIVRLMELAKKGANLDPRHHDLKPLIQAVVSSSKEAKRARDTQEIVEGADALRVYADYECLNQAFTNIVDNAIDAIRGNDGGGLLKITSAEDTEGSQVMVAFENPGGMSAKSREAAMNGKLEKNGRQCSGVYIASHLVNAQGGTFNVESDGETWTRVHVSLPLVQTEED